MKDNYTKQLQLPGWSCTEPGLYHRIDAEASTATLMELERGEIRPLDELIQALSGIAQSDRLPDSAWYQDSLGQRTLACIRALPETSRKALARQDVNITDSIRASADRAACKDAVISGPYLAVSMTRPEEEPYRQALQSNDPAQMRRLQLRDENGPVAFIGYFSLEKGRTPGTFDWIGGSELSLDGHAPISERHRKYTVDALSGIKPVLQQRDALMAIPDHSRLTFLGELYSLAVMLPR